MLPSYPDQVYRIQPSVPSSSLSGIPTTKTSPFAPIQDTVSFSRPRLAIQEGESSLKPKRLILPNYRFEAGQNNAITDVPGVKVGQVTIKSDGPVHLRTGFTTILPHGGDMTRQAVWATAETLNGNGELTGAGPLEDEGVLLSPIVLGSTYSQAQMIQAVHEFYRVAYPEQPWPRGLPVTGECYDGYLSDIAQHGRAVPMEAALQSIINAHNSEAGQPVEQGAAGAGTGMLTFRMHAGIGSASRKVQLPDPETGQLKTYTIGILVNSNHSRPRHLDPSLKQALEGRLGYPTDQLIPEPFIPGQEPSGSKQGSIMMVMATDIPLGPHQLKQLAKHAPLGLAKTGSTMSTTSGDFFVGFSTATQFDYEQPGAINTPMLNPNDMNPVYEALVECIEEAQVNAILGSYDSLNNRQS